MKTRLRFFLSCLFICSIITTKAQKDIFVGLKAGVSIPELSGGNDHINPLQNGYKTTLRGAYGIVAEFQINHKFSLHTGFDYLQEGGKNQGLQAFINPYPGLVDQPYLYADYTSEVKLDYLMIPVMLKYTIPLVGKWKFFAGAGGFAAYATAAESATWGSSPVYLDAEGKNEQDVFPGAVFSFEWKENVVDSIRRFNAGVIVSVGFSYEIGRGKLFAEGGGNYGFVNLQKNENYESNYAGALTFQLGYAYNIRRKRR